MKNWKYVFGFLAAGIVGSCLLALVSDVGFGIGALLFVALLIAGWTYGLLILIQAGGLWEAFGLIAAILSLGIIPILIIYTIRHFRPDFLEV